jgi:hypothetical protein
MLQAGRSRIRFSTRPLEFSHTTALGLNQPLTEMSTRNLYWSKARPELKADNLIAI